MLEIFVLVLSIRKIFSLFYICKKREKEIKKREERKMLILKMVNLKMENLKPKAWLRPISHKYKEFNEFIKGKGFKGRNEYKLKDLKAKFGFKPMYDRRALTISSKDSEPTTFDS